MQSDKKQYVYIVECADHTYYTGWTTDVKRRVACHNSGKGAKYTRSRLPVVLRYTEEFETKQEAMRREYAIKQMTRQEKERLMGRAEQAENTEQREKTEQTEGTAKTRRVSDSRTLQHYILMPGHMNSSGSLFGGQLLSWIDMLAGIVAIRHGDTPVVTASIDRLEFKEGAYEGDVLTLDGRVTWVGNTSMEVRIDTYRKARNEEQRLINTAILVMVAMDPETHKPMQIPKIAPETEEEIAEYEAATKRAWLRKQRRKENF